MIDITKDNQSELIYFVEKRQDEISSIQAKYDWDKYNQYNNLQTEFSSLFFDPLYAIAFKKTGSHIDTEILFKELTKPQKVIYALNMFHGQVRNGGIYQFFWNLPEFSHAVEQSLIEIKASELLSNYQKVSKEFLEKEAELNHLRNKSALNTLVYRVKQFILSFIGKQDKGLRSEGFEHFTEGYDVMKDSEWFDTYFYENEKELYQKESIYVLENLDKIISIK